MLQSSVGSGTRRDDSMLIQPRISHRVTSLNRPTRETGMSQTSIAKASEQPFDWK